MTSEMPQPHIAPEVIGCEESAQGECAISAAQSPSLEDLLVGRIALALKVLSLKQLSEALNALKSCEATTLLQYLRSGRLITEEQYRKVVQVLETKRAKYLERSEADLTERAFRMEIVRSGEVDVRELERYLLLQERLRRTHLRVSLGELLVGQGVLSEEQHDRMLRLPRSKGCTGPAPEGTSQTPLPTQRRAGMVSGTERNHRNTCSHVLGPEENRTCYRGGEK